MSWFWFIVLLVVAIGGWLYVRALLKRVQIFVLSWFVLRSSLAEFHQHLIKMQTKPVLYSDPTVQELVEHIKFVSEQIQRFEKDSYLIELYTPEDVDAFEEESNEPSPFGSKFASDPTREEHEEKVRQVY